MNSPLITVLASYVTELIFHVPRLMKAGETIEGPFETGNGGKGFNMSIACKRAGCDVQVIMKVGKDAFGDTAERMLHQSGIDTTMVFRDNEHLSGAGVVLLLPNGENAIAVDSGANMYLTPQEVSEAREILERSDIILSPLEMPVPAITEAFRIARKSGARTILNPAPAPNHLLPPELVSNISVITPNCIEAETMTGISLQTNNSVRAAGDRLHDLGIPDVVITLGSRGAYYSDGGNYGFIHAPDVNVVDTTGAGDAFNSGLAVALARGASLGDATEFGTKVASIKVTRKGTAKAMPFENEILNWKFPE
jgi:ribokinase